MITHRESKGQRVFDHYRIAAYVSLPAYATELMNARIRTYVRARFDYHMTRERSRVGHDDLVPYDAIVCDVSLSHNQALVADLREHPSAFRATMYGHEFAYRAARTDARLRRLAPVFQVLRSEPYGDEGKDVRVVAYVREPVYDYVRVEPHAVAQGYLVAYDGIGAYKAVVSQGSARADDCRRMDGLRGGC
jgi:hypothetical protein